MEKLQHTSITDPTAFKNCFVPEKEDSDIVSYIVMFIGAVYHHQEWIATHNEQHVIYSR